MSFKSWFDSKATWLKILLGVLLLIVWPIGIIALAVYLINWFLESQNNSTIKNLDREDTKILEKKFDKCVVCLNGEVNLYKGNGVFGLFPKEIVACSECDTHYKKIGVNPSGVEKYQIGSNSHPLLNSRVVYAWDFEMAAKGKEVPIVKYASNLEKAQQENKSLEILVDFNPIPKPNSEFSKNSEDYFFDDYSTLMEERAKRQYQSGFVGVRVVKGVYVGGSKGQSYSIGELKQIDSGKLRITNKRIIFSGALKNVEIKFKDINHIEFGKDFISIGVSNREKMRYFGLDDGVLGYLCLLTAQNSS